jgi:hypothetical protein
VWRERRLWKGAQGRGVTFGALDGGGFGMWFALIMAWGRPPADEAPDSRCDPQGHQPTRAPVPFPTLTCPVQLPWDDGGRAQARDQALEVACDPTSTCRSDCAALTAWVEADRDQDRLLADLTFLAQRQALGDCDGTGAALWACLGRAPVPERFGLRLEVAGGEVTGAAVVGPLLPEGPVVGFTLGQVDHGCGITRLGADARLLQARYGGMPVERIDLSGYVGAESAARADDVLKALRADLERVPALVEQPPPACEALVGALSNQQGADAVWSCFGLTPLPAGMRSMIRFHTRSITRGGVTGAKRLGLDVFDLEGPLLPGTPPVVLAVDGEGTLRQWTDPLAPVDPRWR